MEHLVQELQSDTNSYDGDIAHTNEHQSQTARFYKLVLTCMPNRPDIKAEYSPRTLGCLSLIYTNTNCNKSSMTRLLLKCLLWYHPVHAISASILAGI